MQADDSVPVAESVRRFPAVHVAQVADAEALYWPELQLVQAEGSDAVLGSVKRFPAVQSVHELEAEPLNWPVLHEEHAEDCSGGWGRAKRPVRFRVVEVEKRISTDDTPATTSFLTSVPVAELARRFPASHAVHEV